MVYRIFVEKKEGNDLAARELLQEGRELLGITGLTRLRLINRYDVEDVTPALFENAVRNVLIIGVIGLSM